MLSVTQPRSYIPVGPTYRLPGPVYALGSSDAGSLRVEVDSEHGEYIEKKRDGAGLWDSAASRAQLEERARVWVEDVIQRDQPGLLGRGGETLDSMISKIQEDIVLMHRPENQFVAAQAKAVYVNVNFPSGWCPRCALSKSFLGIHADVPAVDKFGPLERKAAADLLFGKRDSVRFVWGLSPNNELDHRKCRRRPEEGSRHDSVAVSWRSAHAAWLRVERQVISPIDDRTACFFIRIYRYKVRDLDKSVRGYIRQSLETMPPTVRRYKGVEADYGRILSLL